MRCCVPWCKHDSTRTSKSQGITFHLFPVEAKAREAWLNALSDLKLDLKAQSTVCSHHFQPDDLYETRSGLRKVRSGAVPVINMDSTSHQRKPCNLKVCRICLSTDVKLFMIRKYKLDHAYENLTGLVLTEDDVLPRQVCTECAQRLINCARFREKSLRANSLMLDVVRDKARLTMQSIKSIDRYANNLSSQLSIKPHNLDSYNLYIEECIEEPVVNEQTDRIDINSSSIQEMDDENLDMEIKNEDGNEVFISENDNYNDVKDELEVDNEHNDNDFTPNDLSKNATDNEENGDCDDILYVDYNLTDKDFSSDDSLPLERSRSKKKIKTKKKVVKRDDKKEKKLATEPKIDRRRKPFLNDDLNETLFTVTDLTFDEQIAEINKRQESANYRNAVYKCTECYKGFLDEDAYNGHMTRHTNQCGEYRCSICKTHFKHPHALRKHITAHHTQRFSCNQCPYVTTHRQTARLHERWHKGTKYHCPHCKDEFVKFTTYMGHIRIKHPSDFVCQLCGFSFVSQKGIELHKKLKHRLDIIEIPDDGPYCEPCNVRFVSADAHRQHLRVSARHNTDDKESRESNKPKKGRKTFEEKEKERRLREKNNKELGEDRRVYPSQMRKAEGPIPCEQCGMQLEDSRAYHGHFRRMHPDKNRTKYPSMKSPCMCEVCGRMFQSYALLKDHRWTHTGERPFACDSCGKSFRMKQRLVAHRRVHSQVKASYVCSLCGKHFSTHSNRQRHMFIHTGLKPFKCEMCGKCFKHASEKRAHITYVHLKKPWPKRSRGKRRDGRQGSLPPQGLPSGNDVNIVQPIWPCDPKIDHLVMDDKPVYYNLKI